MQHPPLDMSPIDPSPTSAAPIAPPHGHTASPAAPTTPADSAEKRTRSREGCLVCRSRRIKCDNGKPECARCTKYGAECVYPEKKKFDARSVTESLSRRHRYRKQSKGNGEGEDDGEAEGDNGGSVSQFKTDPSSTLPSHIEPSFAMQPYDSSSFEESLPSSIAAALNNLPQGGSAAAGTDTPNPLPLPLVMQQPTGIFDVDDLMTFFRQTQMGAYYRQRVEPPDFLRPAFPDPDELRSFHHCVTYSFSICVTREDFNPWVQHVAPLFLFPDGQAPLSAEAVRWVMLEIGAVHLSYLDRRDSATPTDGTRERTLGAMYRNNALRLLRQARTIEAECKSDTFLAATTLQLLAEILSAGTQWREVYRMMRSAVLSRGGCERMLFGDAARPETPSSLRKYLVEQVCLLEIIASEAEYGVPVLLLGNLEWFDRLGQLVYEDDAAESIESAFGVQRKIFRLSIQSTIICGQMEQASRLHLPDQSSPPLPSPEITAALFTDMRAWRADLPGAGLDTRTYLGSLAYWHACMIMLYRTVERRPRSDAEVEQSAVAVLDAVVEAGEKIEFILWPVLVACCNLLSPLLRGRAREILKTFQYQCCYEIEVTSRVVEETWRRVDEGRDDAACDYREIMTDLGCAVLLG